MHRRRGRLRPARLGDRVVEEGALLGQPLERRGRSAARSRRASRWSFRSVSPWMRITVWAARPRRRRRAAAPRARPRRRWCPAPRRSAERESETSWPANVREVHRPAAPIGTAVVTVWVRTRRRLAAAPHRDPERHRPVFRRAQGEVEHRPRGQRDLEADRLRRARHQRLAEDVAQPLPAHAGRHLGQVLAAEDEPYGLDREVGARRRRWDGSARWRMRAPVTGAGGVMV